MLKGEELSSAYASADVFVMPSETETLGFVALEAMASGMPVVAVAAGGLVDIVTQPGVIGARAGSCGRASLPWRAATWQVKLPVELAEPPRVPRRAATVARRAACCTGKTKADKRAPVRPRHPKPPHA